MLTANEIMSLLAIWRERLCIKTHPNDYKIALSECIMELEQLLDTRILQYLQEQAADSVLSSMEQQEIVA